MGGETARGAEILALAKFGEALDFDSVWLVDHFLWNVVDREHLDEVPPEGSEGLRFGYWECWTLASALAAATSRVEIGTLVTNTGYRNPALLARMAETVDEISGGRVILGIGAGAIAGEYEAFGYDFERRIGRFEEALQILRPMLRGEAVTFDGEFYRTQTASGARLTSFARLTLQLPTAPRCGAFSYGLEEGAHLKTQQDKSRYKERITKPIRVRHRSMKRHRVVHEQEIKGMQYDQIEYRVRPDVKPFPR